jgi:hypothetical protein
VIGLVIVHLLGNLVDFIFHKETGTLQSIFTGYKNIEGESVKLTSFQKILAAIGIILALAIIPYTLLNQKIDPKNEGTEQQGKESESGEDDD